MFKSLLVGAFIVVATSANLYEFNNDIIEYEDTPIQKLLPYPYYDNRIHFAQPEPHSVHRYEPVKVAVPKVAIADVIVPKTGLISSIVSCMLSSITSVISFIVHNIRALIFGCFSIIGVCKYTHFCEQLSTIHSISDVSRGFSTYVTQDRIKRATEFVKEAIKKYTALQEKGSGN